MGEGIKGSVFQGGSILQPRTHLGEGGWEHGHRPGSPIYAQEKLGELYSIELPGTDAEVEQDEPFGVIESSKSVAELISPVSGEVISVNEDIEDDIGVINSDPYGAGWLIMVELRDLDELNNLLDAEEYRE